MNTAQMMALARAMDLDVLAAALRLANHPGLSGPDRLARAVLTDAIRERVPAAEAAARAWAADPASDPDGLTAAVLAALPPEVPRDPAARRSEGCWTGSVAQRCVTHVILPLHIGPQVARPGGLVVQLGPAGYSLIIVPLVKAAPGPRSAA